MAAPPPITGRARAGTTRLLSQRVYTVSFPVAPTAPRRRRLLYWGRSSSRCSSRRVLDSPAHRPAQGVLAHAILSSLAALSPRGGGAWAAVASGCNGRVDVDVLGGARR